MSQPRTCHHVPPRFSPAVAVAVFVTCRINPSPFCCLSCLGLDVVMLPGRDIVVLFDLLPAMWTPAPAGKLNRLLGGPAADAVACWQHFGPNFAYINIYEFIKSEPHTLARSFARRGKLAADWMDECISQPLTSAVGKGYVHWAKIYRFVIITFIISHSISSPNKLYSLFNKIRLFSTKWCWYICYV